MKPFAGIVEGHVWPATGMTTARWKAEIWPEVVYFRSLWLTQSKLEVAALLGYSDRYSDAYPHAVVHDGQAYLEDGHHRVVRYALTHVKRPYMRMRVFRIGGGVT